MTKRADLEIRVTIEVLNPDGDTLASNASEPVLADADDALMGEVEADLDRLIDEALESGTPEDEMCDDDYVMTDARGGGIAISIVGQAGILQTEPDRDAAERFIMLHQLAEKFYPNVWWISDHGNAHLVVLPSDKGVVHQGEDEARLNARLEAGK